MKHRVAAAIESRIKEWHLGRGTCDHPTPARMISLHDLLSNIAGEYNITYDVARSIHAQTMKHVLKMDRSFIHKPRNYVELYLQYLQREPPCKMLDLAIDCRLPPSRLAVQVLSGMLDPASTEGKLMMKKGSKIPKDVKETIYKLYWTGPMNAPIPLDPKYDVPMQLIHDHLVECIRSDTTEGPLVERIKQNVGLEYEYLLQEQLNRAKIEVFTEDELKVTQSVCTPDCVLLVPIEIGGHLCYWIDSKACFGDEVTLADNFTQFHKYTADIGPGLAIYWFGFVEDSPKTVLEYSLSAWEELGIIVSDHLPETFIPRRDKPLKLPTSYTGRVLTTSPTKSARKNP